MFEFNNRVDLQRNVIKIVNNNGFKYEFTGLTKGAIDNWILQNKIDNHNLKELLYQIASKLFFLANKSQEQITEDYKTLSFELSSFVEKLKKELSNQ